jgi:subtilisin family serine protease
VTVVRRVEAIGLVVVRVDPAHRDAALAQLRASPAVARAGKDALVDALETVPNDDDWPAQWGLQKVQLPAAWDKTHGSSSVIVAVLDTGVDAAHPDLSGATLPGFDLVNGDNNPADDEGHGTGVAGVIAARTNNRVGIAGVCWGCSILPVKVLGSDGSGDLATVAAGIVRAVDAGAQVINLSLGGPAGDPSLDDAVAYATRNGVLVVAAAGNNGSPAQFYPAATPGVLSVAASDESDHLYSWSNYGQWVALAAPGCDPTALRGGDYGIYCGTSFATPVVSGLLGLARSLSPTATRNDLIDAVERSATSIGAQVGRGRINAAATLAALPTAPAPIPAPGQPATKMLKGSLSKSGRQWSSKLSIGPGAATATVTWTGPAELTVTLSGPGGTIAQQTGSSPLQVNGDFAAGRLTAAVSGPRAKQSFSITLLYPPVATAAEAPRPPSAPAVLLSPVPQLASALPGPQLGAPPPSTGLVALGFGLLDRPTVATSLVAAINQVRREHRLPVITSSPQLARAALAHVRALAASGRFAHEWSDGTPFDTWILRYFPAPRSGTWVAGENLVWGPASMTPQAALAAWLASPAHRQILLDPRWRQFGAGAVVCTDAPGVYGGADALIVAGDFGATATH